LPAEIGMSRVSQIVALGRYRPLVLAVGSAALTVGTVQALALATHVWALLRPIVPRVVWESLATYWVTAPLGHLLSPGGKPLPLAPFGEAEPFVLCAVGLGAGLVLLAVASRRRVRLVGARSSNGGLRA
jgi:hypothetical protein